MTFNTIREKQFLRKFPYLQYFVLFSGDDRDSERPKKVGLNPILQHTMYISGADPGFLERGLICTCKMCEGSLC